MAYKVIYNFSDGTTDELDGEIYETYEEAEREAAQAASDFSQGGDYLREAGEDYCEATIVDWDIIEV
ncbi:hypothetical protein [Butyrivibrio hungatei]|uniref:Uncharacterized protein n=1 Tax=Butyrivibrio hungatei TaxID=185008 RepID=A0A1D9NXI2_9FIRM|nr:hypothetical protein [Butyrivibrio hungatei]AOZ94953.1 hypothetical protein bhn_III005 [Butyrivibrio hungatei]